MKGKSDSRGATRILIFDVDDVLLDVRHSYQRTVLETVRRFTGKRVTYEQLHEWKNRPGYNDDWRLTADWVASLGRVVPYETVKEQYIRIFWGKDGAGKGNIHRERWLVSVRDVRRWAQSFELAVFTGRNREEFGFSFEAWPGHQYFRRVVTAEDVKRGKPDPEGLLLILGGRDPGKALYLGDNVDDAKAARAAGVPFLGVLSRGSLAHRKRAAGLRRLGALAILHHVRELEGWVEKNARWRDTSG